ncbi:hypothetical protein Pmani_027561 [Petrolisthes manimaculis]|uniref:Uncharacterized protein n=1 Tax=Petrolisthes manimaculis TaxID=1843537 RepID=A0AAE1P3G8_9EUCA|nr:hypothetical protein Pmani_027561 [Petrolisthes manimaculis]
MSRCHLSPLMFFMVVVVTLVCAIPSDLIAIPKFLPRGPRAVEGLDSVLADYVAETPEDAFKGLSTREKYALEAMLVVMLNVPPGTEKRQHNAKEQALARALRAAVLSQHKYGYNTTEAWREIEAAYHRHRPGVRLSRGEDKAASEIKLHIQKFFMSSFWSRLSRNRSRGTLFVAVGTGVEILLKRIGIEGVGSTSSVVEILWLTHRVFTDIMEYMDTECYLPTFWPFSCFIPDHCVQLAYVEQLNIIQSKWYCWFASSSD